MTDDLYPAGNGHAVFTSEQINVLLKPINPKRVAHSQGQSHLEAFDVIAHLNRLFGFGNWDQEIIELTCVREHSVESKAGDKTRTGWWVTYRAQVRLTIRPVRAWPEPVCRYEDAASGDAQNIPTHGDAHDQAMKTAISQALKRCARLLGDQFGLSLYDGGSTAPLVRRLVHMPPPKDLPVDLNDGLPDSPGVAGRVYSEPVPVEPEPVPEPEYQYEVAFASGGHRDITQAQIKAIATMTSKRGLDAEGRRALVGEILGRPPQSLPTLSVQEASTVIEYLKENQ